jgi:hypothetical protein
VEKKGAGESESCEQAFAQRGGFGRGVEGLWQPKDDPGEKQEGGGPFGAKGPGIPGYARVGEKKQVGQPSTEGMRPEAAGQSREEESASDGEEGGEGVGAIGESEEGRHSDQQGVGGEKENVESLKVSVFGPENGIFRDEESVVPVAEELAFFPGDLLHGRILKGEPVTED